MKKRKLLTMTVASALVAAQMAIPVMAAGGSGTIDVEMENTETVLKVQVPTTFSIAVNEFAQGDDSQITSKAFEMVNKSAVPVSVEVTSTATLNIGINFAESDAVNNANAELWLAVAAQTAKNTYGAGVETLTAKSANVTTFDKTAKTAKQTFYLAEGTGATTYKFVDVANIGEVGENDAFAEYHELTVLTAGANASDDINTTSPDTTAASFKVQVDASDLYAIKTDGSSNNVMTKIAKGSTATYDPGSTYYTAASDTTALADVAANKQYVYSEMATANTTGGTAAFRYIGKLSSNQSWSINDVKGVSIAYTITGVTGANYKVAAADCVYGLYTAPVAPDIATKTFTLEKDKALSIPFTVGSGSKEAKDVKVMYEGENLMSDGSVVLDEKNVALVLPVETVNYLIDTNAAATAADKILPAKFEVLFNDTEAGSGIEITLNAPTP